MRYAVAMSASQPQAIIDLPWSADSLTVTNSTTAILYIRVGGRDYPTATNFDHAVPGGVSRTLPVVGGSFALTLYAGPVGALGGSQGFTARCDCLFLRDEAPPSMAGYALPPATQTTTLAPFSGLIIDGRGFDSVFVSMGRPASNPGLTWWTIDEGPTATGPWTRLASYAQFFGIGGASITRHIPVGPGYLSIGYTSSDINAKSTVYYRGRSGPADQSLVRTFRTAFTTTFTNIDSNPRNLLDYPAFAGRVVAIALKLTGLNASAEPSIELDIYPDANWATYFTSLVVGRVGTPQAPFYPNGAIEVGAADPWLMDGDATSRYWYVPVDLATMGYLRVDIANLSTLAGGLYTLPKLVVAPVLDVEV